MMRGHPGTVCMCLVVLVGGLDLKRAQVPSFPRLSQAWPSAPLLLSSQHPTSGDEGGSQVTGSETMRLEPELVLFTLSVSSSLAHFPQREAMLEQEDAKWASCMCQGADWDGPRIPVRVLGCPWWCLCEHQSWLPSLCSDVVLGLGQPCPHSCTLSLVMAFFILAWRCPGEREGPEQVIHSICGGHGKPVRGLGGFNLLPPPFLQEEASMCELFRSRV